MRLTALPAVLTVLLLSPAGRAGVYSFVDSDGVVHFTNVPTDPRYRSVDGKAGGKRRPSGKRRRGGRVIPPKANTTFDPFIGEASQRFNIPEPLIRAVIAVESNFNVQAVSHAGAEGLMQLMPQTAEEMGVEDPFDPRQNILGGTRYLRLLANAFDGDLVLTLAGYNAGHRAVSRHMDIPPFAETQQYVRRVLQLYFHYKKEQPPAASGPEKQGKAR